jgi:hypothetical protein
VDEGAADAPVPVGERVDGLELRVGDGGLDDRRQIRSVHERDEVVHHALRVPRRRVLCGTCNLDLTEHVQMHLSAIAAYLGRYE